MVSPTTSELLWKGYIAIDRQSQIITTPTSVIKYSDMSDNKSYTTIFSETNTKTIMSVPDNDIPAELSLHQSQYVVEHPHRYSQASPISDSIPFVYDNIQHAIRQAPIW